MTNPPPSIAAAVHYLTRESARTAFPALFEGDEHEPYFNELGAHGNNHWIDSWPDEVVVVAAHDGRVIMACNAASWHMRALGYEPS